MLAKLKITPILYRLYISDFWEKIDGAPITTTSKNCGQKVVLIGCIKTIVFFEVCKLPVIYPVQLV